MNRKPGTWEFQHNYSLTADNPTHYLYSSVFDDGTTLELRQRAQDITISIVNPRSNYRRNVKIKHEHLKELLNALHSAPLMDRRSGTLEPA